MQPCRLPRFLHPLFLKCDEPKSGLQSFRRKVPIQSEVFGIIRNMVTYLPATVAIQDLLLDPNNFRFKHPASGTEIAEQRFEEESVQKAAIDRVKSDGIEELKNSIRENGFVPVERIIVREYSRGRASDDDNSQKYVVVEGNRRTTALKTLQNEHDAGVGLNPTIVDTFSQIPVLLAQGATEEDLLAIMGIRHVGGPKEWGGYQSALLIYQLVVDGGQTSREVAHRLGLSTQEVNRRHRAFSALNQMKQDPEFGDAVTPELYPIFHEAVGTPTTRKWLGWDAQNLQFSDNDNRELFYGWITPNQNKLRKIRGYEDVRDLKLILENSDALTALKDDDQTFADALAIVKSEAKATRWLPNAKAALNSLNEMSSEVMRKLDETGVDILQQLKKQSAFIVQVSQMPNDPDDDETQQ